MSLQIISQPLSQIAVEGGIATFFITVIGIGPISYQWYYNSESIIPNQTNSILTLPSVSLSSAGSYYCTAYSTEGGPVTSSMAALVVDPAPPSLGCMIPQQELTWNPYIPDGFGGHGNGYLLV